jgi:hypothetical protein
MADAFHAILRWQAQRPACWYCVPYVASHPHKGLWQLLGLEAEKYNQLLSDMGLAYRHGKTWRTRLRAIENIGVSANLEEGSFYASVFAGGSRMYIRLGFFLDNIVHNPSDSELAFSSFQVAPTNLRSQLLLNSGDTSTGTINQASGDANSQEQEEPSANKDMQVRLMELLMPLLSDDAQKLCQRNRFWKQDITDDTLESTLLPLTNSLHAQDRKKHGERLSIVASPQSKDILVEDASPYPVLNSYNIPLRKANITIILAELIKLQKDVMKTNQIDLFQLKNPTYTNQSMKLVVIKQHNSRRSFYEEMQKSDVFLHAVQTIATGKVSVDDATMWVLCHLGRKNRDAFYKACSKLNIMTVQKVMDPITSNALWDYVSIGIDKRRKLLRFFYYHFGWRFTCSEGKTRALVPEAIPQLVGEFIDEKDQKKKHYYSKKIDEVLLVQLNRAAETFTEDELHADDVVVYQKRLDLRQIAKVEVIFGGDHGQGSSKFTVKYILRLVHKVEPFVFIERVAQIDCKKDSYDLVKQTVAGELNDALQRLADAEGLFIFEYTTGNETGCYVSLTNVKRRDTDNLLRTVSIFLGCTGDLLFYSMILGKENMANKWCWRCRLSVSQWQNLCNVGEAWTMATLAAHVEKLKQMTRKPTSRERMGVKELPLFPAIPLENHFFPLLHGIQLNINFVMKSFFKFLDYMVEDCPFNVVRARIVVEKAEWSFQNQENEARECTLENETAKTQATAGILQWTRQKATTINPEEMELIDAVLREFARTEQVALEKKDAAVKALKEERKQVAKAKAALKRIDKRSIMEKKVRMGLEQAVLEDHGAERSAYHGGDYEGSSALVFLQKAKTIFADTETFLLSTDKSTRHEKCTDDMISQMCGATSRLLTYYDGIRCLARIPVGCATPEDIALMDRLIDETVALELVMFTNLTPKHHSKFVHLKRDFRRNKGCGCYAEDWVEKDHQLGKVHEVMTKAIPSRAKAFAMHSRAGEQSNLVKASGIKEAMLQGTKRKQQQTENEDETLTAQERIEAVLNLPSLVYTIGTVNVIIRDNRRIEVSEDEEDTEQEQEEQEEQDGGEQEEEDMSE